MEAVNPLDGGEIDTFFPFACQRVRHFQFVPALRTTCVFAFSLVVELMTAVATCAVMAGRTGRRDD